MGQMLSRESVRSRIGSSAGMCFTEFTYQLFQAYDFVMLSQRNNCWIQIGGSDQWGNITAGIELFKKMQSEADVSDDIVRKVMIYGKHVYFFPYIFYVFYLSFSLPLFFFFYHFFFHFNLNYA